MKMSIPISDLISALYGVQGILYALLQRVTTGRGQYVDIAMLHAMVSLMQVPGERVRGHRRGLPAAGEQDPSWTPYRLFKSADGYVNIACGNNGLWLTLCDQLGLAHLKSTHAS